MQGIDAKVSPFAAGRKGCGVMQEQNIWQQPEEALFRTFSCSAEGLTDAEGRERLRQYGPNELSDRGRKSVGRIFLEQFADFLVAVLLAAAGVSAFLGDAESAVVILAVVSLNAILGTVQTVKAAASLESLKQLSAPVAKVLRGGRLQQIPGREVVPGDVVVLEAGDSVCADGRLLECAALKCAESALTGESLPVEKMTGILPEDISLGDRKNMVFSGSFVTYGRGKFLVTSTGMQTEMGRIAGLLDRAENKKTPLQESLDRFGRKLTVIVLGLCALLFFVSVFVRKENAMQAFLFAVALAVAAIPEALSSIVTIVLSIGTRKMARENAVIRRLQAVEGLGSVSVICSDKTGTLTRNRMTARQIYVDGRILTANEADPDSLEQTLLFRAALLCNDATVDDWKEIGDPTETALVRFGNDCGLNAESVRMAYPRLGELPFDSERKLMSTVHRMDGRLWMLTKGAADALLDRSQLSAEERKNIEEANVRFSAEGLRVLAFACRQTESPHIGFADETQLQFLGLVAMMDPPRKESAAAVAECIAAGIRPVMITGDHKVTAEAIAREIGILMPGTEAVTGSDIEQLSDEALRELVPKVSVYARVSPEHKIRIVRAWQEAGHLVAMTGDGVNDAPALKQADIGVAMGITGTEVAKDAAGMVLADDNFATIVGAVKNGRNVYANIRRAIHFLLSGNAAGILTVLYASLLGLPVPFAAAHLLFINLLTDSLPAIALGLEHHSDGVMKERPRRREEGILDRSFLCGVAVEGLALAAATVAAFYVGLQEDAAVAGTMAFATLCLSRLLHGFSCKAERPVLFSRKFWNNRVLLAAFGAGTVLLAAVLLIPTLQPLFYVAELSGYQLAVSAGLALESMLSVQLIKMIRGRG